MLKDLLLLLVLQTFRYILWFLLRCYVHYDPLTFAVVLLCAV